MFGFWKILVSSQFECFHPTRLPEMSYARGCCLIFQSNPLTRKVTSQITMQIVAGSFYYSYARIWPFLFNNKAFWMENFILNASFLIVIPPYRKITHFLLTTYPFSNSTTWPLPSSSNNMHFTIFRISFSLSTSMCFLFIFTSSQRAFYSCWESICNSS